MLQQHQRWDQFRDQMAIVDNWAYFDHAAVAPISKPARLAVEAWADEAAAHGEGCWSDWRKKLEDVRRMGAELIAAKPAEIALVRNTTEGINLVAEGIRWERGDNVVTLSSEFPSNLYPWMNLADRGVETRIVEAPDERVDANRLADACDSRTRVVSVSWVGYATGWRNDLAALAEAVHSKGALLFVDAIQGLGVFPLDVEATHIDFLAADGHKWMLGPEGAGLFYVRREHLDSLRPLGVGWNSVQQAGDFRDKSLKLKQSAARYEGGSHNMVGFLGLGASLEMLLSYGCDALSARVLEITDEICRRLADAGAMIASCRDGERRSGIIACEIPGSDAGGLTKECRDRGVLINARDGRVRISPHAYTSEGDIDRLMAGLYGE